METNHTHHSSAEMERGENRLIFFDAPNNANAQEKGPDAAKGKEKGTDKEQLKNAKDVQRDAEKIQKVKEQKADEDEKPLLQTEISTLDKQMAPLELSLKEPGAMDDQEWYLNTENQIAELKSQRDALASRLSQAPAPVESSETGEVETGGRIAGDAAEDAAHAGTSKVEGEGETPKANTPDVKPPVEAKKPPVEAKKPAGANSPEENEAEKPSYENLLNKGKAMLGEMKKALQANNREELIAILRRYQKFSDTDRQDLSVEEQRKMENDLAQERERIGIVFEEDGPRLKEGPQPLSEQGQALAGAMRGLGMSKEAADKFARSLEALAALFKTMKEMFGKTQFVASEVNQEDEEDDETAPDKKNKGKGTEDTPEGDEGGPEGFDPKTVQNPKKEAEELGDLDEKEKGLQAKLQDLGKKLDGDTTTEELDTIIKEMQELSTQLKEVEENVQKKEALEKEHDRRVAVVGKEWKDALEKSGLPENERAFITMELGGDGDDLVLTMREELNNEAAVKALTAMGFKVADGTLRKEDASPKLFSEEGQEKLQKICEMAAIPLKLEKKEGAEGEALPPGAAENIAELGLSKHEDGNYAREGHDGGYIVQKDGSIFYTGGPGPGGKTSSQTYANGKWDKERNKRLV